MSKPWIEIPLKEAELIMRRIRRLLALRKEIGAMSFSDFQTCDIGELMRVMNSDIKNPAQEEDIAYLERRVRAIKESKQSRPREIPDGNVPC